MQQTIATFIDDVSDWYIWIDLETGYDSYLIAFLQVSKGLVYNVFNLYLCLTCLLDFI
jgi:hypothetical protein